MADSHTSGAAIVANVSRGASALSLGTVIAIIGQLVVIPIAMRSWGPARWGEWTVLAAFTSLLAMSDLGVQNFVVNRMRAAHSTGERGEFLRTLKSALLVDIPMTGALFAILAAIIWFLPLTRILGLHMIGRLELAVLLLLLALEPLIGVPMGIIGGVYRATGRLARGAMTGNARQAATLVTTLVLVATGGSFLMVGIGRIVMVVLVSAWIVADLAHLYPWLLGNGERGDWSEGVAMIVPGLFFLLIPFANYLGNEFILMIVQRSFGGGAVSQYSTHRTAINFARTISGMITVAAWPELTALYARGEFDRLARAHRGLAKWNFWLVGAMGGAVFMLLPLVYGSWTLRRLSLDQWTLGLLAVRVVLWGLWSGSMTLLLSINRQRAAALSLAASAALAGVLAFFLVPRIGISGAAMALLIGDVCVPAWLIPTLACRETRERPLDFYRAMYAPAASLVMGFVLVFLGWEYLPVRTVHYSVIPASVAAAVALMWLFLSPVERKLAAGFGRKALAMPMSFFQRS